MNLLNHKLFWFLGLAAFPSFPETLCALLIRPIGSVTSRGFSSTDLLAGIKRSPDAQKTFCMTHTRENTLSPAVRKYFTSKRAPEFCIRKTYLRDCLRSLCLIMVYSVRGVRGQCKHVTESDGRQVIKTSHRWNTLKNTTYFQGWICCSAGYIDDRQSTLHRRFIKT